MKASRRLRTRGGRTATMKTRTRPRLHAFDESYRSRWGCVAGVDEAGRGPWAGPVVAAAVVLPPRIRLPHLNDSKKLSAFQRETLYRQIQQVACAIGVGVVPPEEIDRLNIRQASFLAMRLALQQLILPPDHVLVDGFRIPQLFLSQTAVIGGDGKSASIAAASIIAKVTRDAWMVRMDRQYPGYGFARHKGYGTSTHRDSLALQGPCAIHRRSFAPVRARLAASSTPHE